VPPPPPLPPPPSPTDSVFYGFYGLDEAEAPAALFRGVILEAREGPVGEWQRLWNITDPELSALSHASTATGGWVAVESQSMPPGDGWVLRWRHQGECCYAWGLKNITTRYKTP